MPCVLRKITLLVVVLCVVWASVFAQAVSDTLKPRHSPAKATLYSAIIPGLGQAYNQHYWKVPVVYALAGTCAYFVWYNNDNYNYYREKYYYLINFKKQNPDNDLSSFPDEISKNEQALKRATDYYRRYRDLSAIGIIVVYTLNILEANVSAHFFEYDISENLSMNVAPSLTPGLSADLTIKPVYGFNCSFRF